MKWFVATLSFWFAVVEETFSYPLPLAMGNEDDCKPPNFLWIFTILILFFFSQTNTTRTQQMM